MVPVPVPVPVYIPVPLNMNSQQTPIPLALPLPVCFIHQVLVFPLRFLFSAGLSSLSWQLPVPLLIPPQKKKSVEDAAVQWESQDELGDVCVSAAGGEKGLDVRKKVVVCNIFNYLSVQEAKRSVGHIVRL